MKSRWSAVKYLLCLGIVTASLIGCGAAADAGQKVGEGDETLKVVCTIFPQYDVVRRIAGENAEYQMLLKPGEEVHSYEPTPKDIRDIRDCDLFIYVGGENDVWVERILESMGEDAPQTLRLVDLVDTVEEEIVEGMQGEKGHDHEEGEDSEDHEEDEDHLDEDSEDHEEDGEVDEHVWTSPVNVMEITEKIAATMSALDPTNADLFAANSEAYVAELEELDAAFREVTVQANRSTLVFGDRFPFRYFADEYGLDYAAAFSGCSSESEPSAATLVYLINKVRDEEIPVVFSIEFSSGNIARSICEATGAKQLTFHSCHNITRDEFESGETYLSLMWGNVDVLREALQ